MSRRRPKTPIPRSTLISGQRGDGEKHVVAYRGHWSAATAVGAARRCGLVGEARLILMPGIDRVDGQLVTTGQTEVIPIVVF